MLDKYNTSKNYLQLLIKFVIKGENIQIYMVLCKKVIAP